MPLWIAHQDAPSDVTDPYGYARVRDRIGDRVHTGMAALWGASIILGTFPAALMTAIGAAYAILRVWATNPTYALLFKRWLFKLLVLLLLFNGLSLFWSADQAQGLDELKIFRLHIPFLLAAWPILHQRGRLWLTAGVCLSAVIAAGAQIAQASGLEFGWYDPGVPNRYPGLVHPSSTGIVQMTAACIAIAWLCHGRHRWDRIAGLAVLIACIAGLVLAGSRASWIAAALAWPLSLVLCGRQHVESSVKNPGRRNVVMSVLAVLVGVTAIVVYIKRDTFLQRVDDAGGEIRSAWVEGNYQSDTGARIFQARLSWELFLRRPLIGCGLGSYHEQAVQIARQIPVAESSPAEVETESEADFAQQGRSERPVLDHPHSAVLYVAVTTGAVGLGLWLAFWLTLFGTSIAVARRAGVEVYCIVLPAIVIGLAVSYTFDCQNLSAPGTSVLLFITCLVLRPTEE